MIKECPMRHENGNCLSAGGFCTAVREITCEALQNAYQMGYMDMGNRAKAEDVVRVVRCKDCMYFIKGCCVQEDIRYGYVCGDNATTWIQSLFEPDKDFWCKYGERKDKNG